MSQYNASNKITYSEEQLAPIKSGGQAIGVNAFAGAGKTSMLVGRAEENSRKRILCCVLNKAIQLEAEARFPKNVTSKTSHSIAYGQVGYRYRHKLNEAKPYLISQTFTQFNMGNEQQRNKACALVSSTLNRFMTYPDLMIDLKHVDAHEAVRNRIDPHEIVKWARIVWEAQVDPNNSFPLPHDGYLKLFQISQPRLNYDEIYIDEFQDTNAVLLAILLNQRHADKVMVGDVHQNIYGFRNSVNGFEIVNMDERFALTGSFRFGPEIADVANNLLGVFKNEELKIRGLGDSTSVAPVKSEKDPYAVICRTNAGVFDAAVERLKVQPDANLDFAGGVGGYGFERIMDTFNLKNGNSRDVRDPFLRSFDTYEKLERYANDVDDKELLSRINVLEKYKEAVPSLIHNINAASTRSTKQGIDMVLSTAHKSKGLEFPVVKLHSDFPDLVNSKGLPLSQENAMRLGDDEEPLDEQEVNLIYVAATRARKQLDITESSLNAFLSSNHHMTQARSKKNDISAELDPLSFAKFKREVNAFKQDLDFD